MSLWRARRRQQWTHALCVCDCHAGCPLAGQRTVPQGVWQQRCTCPGAVRLREEQARTEQRNREVAEVLAEVERTGPRDAEEIERRLRAVYQAHGETPPPLTAWSRLAAAGTARRGTRNARVLWLGVRAVAAGVRWAWQPADDDPEENRAQTRTGYRVAGAVVGIAGLMTVAASQARGWRRPVVTLIAAVTWLVAGWALTLVTGVAALSRAVEDREEPLPPPGGGRKQP
jgi:hypothetical protein